MKLTHRWSVGHLALLFFVFCARAWAQSPQGSPQDLTQVSLETLMNMDVSLASKKEQKISQTAAAIYVITQEDIRRSGLTSIPELLRLVPGLDVAHIDGHRWAISARGFNDLYGKKLLVLIDGRSVYSPAFAGVIWNVQDLLLEDIERIEVIRGPGATLWGANAVNGVINIITKRARDTQGGLVTASAGSQERGTGAIRFGAQAGDKLHYRVYAKYFNRGEFASYNGQGAEDSWSMVQGGFRADWSPNHRDTLTVQGDLYRNSLGLLQQRSLLVPPYSSVAPAKGRSLGGDILANWKRKFSDRSDIGLKVYYDRGDRHFPIFSEVRHTVDVDFQHHFALNKRNDLIWGLGYRFTSRAVVNSFDFMFLPAHQRNQLFSGFVQHELVLMPNRVRLTVGAKLENDPFTGWEFQPNLRLLWTPQNNHSFWASVSRAVRTADADERGLKVMLAAFPGAGGQTNVLRLEGNPQSRSENLLGYELGYRAQLNRNLSVDVATFYNIYTHLQSMEPAAPYFEATPAPAHLVLPLLFANGMHGESYGAEISATWKVTSRWRIKPAYSWLTLQLHRDPTSNDFASEAIERESPRHQFQLRSELNLPRNFQFDSAIYFVGRLTADAVPSYTRVDLRLGWRPGERVEFSTGVQNLLDPRHLEFAKLEGVIPTQDRRKFYGKVVYRF